ncbi:MAG: methionyl-tRNA formyltransferase [Gammaproteobacteria bacterium]|jgi:methionyl-tRNA formyltransferase|nr:methionyl-tRNA formyltransferase [Gammaproteobacteria bacterium]
MNKPKFIFLGSTQFSRAILLSLIENNFIPEMVFTIPAQFNISYSIDKPVKNYTHACLLDICVQNRIPLHFIEKNSKKIIDFEQEIKHLELDVILVAGWFYIIPQAIRQLATAGAWGIHASLLPAYAGGAPLTWAIINGEKETGISLFRLENGIDDGDIIGQQKISIADTDSIKEVYAKAIDASKGLLLDTFRRFPNVEYTIQNRENAKIYPQRTPDDGEIDLSKPAHELYDFIRAQSPPYPGAFIRTKDGKKLVIEKASIRSD